LRPPRRILLEGVLVTLGAATLCVLVTWPTVRPSVLSATVPWDPTDPRYFTWQLAWVSHALWSDPFGIWTTNAFLQSPDNLAYTDAVLGYGPFGLLLSMITGGGQAGAVIQLNLATIGSHALAFAGAYALARALGARVPGALLAGVAFGFAPWRLQQITHVNVISTGAAALAFALLFRGHGYSLRHGLRPERAAAGLVLLGWLLATWQVSFGFAVGITFGYALAVVVGFLLLRTLLQHGRRFPRGLLAANAVGGLIFLAFAGWMASAFLRVVAAHPESRRDEGWLPLFSPPWQGWITPPEASWIGVDHWKQARTELDWVGETLVSPGWVLIAVGLLGVVLSAWPLHRRLGLLAATAVAFVLASGTHFPGDGQFTFVWLWHHAPGWDSIRTPGRLTVWVTLGLGLLAAGAISRLTDLVWPLPGAGAGPRRIAVPRRGPVRPRRRPVPRTVTARSRPPLPRSRPVLPRTTARLLRARPPAPVPQPWPRRWGRSAAGARLFGPPAPGARGIAAWRPRVLAAFAAPLLVLPAAGALVEGIPSNPFPRANIEPIGLDLKALPQPLLILPTIQFWDYYTLVWSTEGFPTMVNGSSGFDPKEQVAMRKTLRQFPDTDSVAYLRAREVKVVVMLRDHIDGSDWRGASYRGVEGLGLTRVDHGRYVLYYLNQ
jgi:hypothetical protein